MQSLGSEAVQSVIEIVNSRHDSAWSLIGKLPGGYQQGAYQLRQADGSRGVLKWHRTGLPSTQLEETARAIEKARLRGWPTAKWFFYGSLPNDGAYIIEEFIDGIRPDKLEGAILERLLDQVELQAEIGPRSERSWSEYIVRVVSEDEPEPASRMRAHPETATLMARLQQMVRAADRQALPNNDLVHGDFVLNNVIVREGVPHLIDSSHAGRGTRAYDLATLFMETAVGGDYRPPSLSDQRRLEKECLDVAGRDGFLVCIACRMMLLLAFGGVHWSEDVPAAVANCNAFLDSLECL